MSFPTISAIKNADIVSLSEVNGMTKKSAEAVYDFFNSRNNEQI